MEMDETAVEIKRLKGCINNLISVLALPAIWSGHEPAEILSTLLDVLLGMLRLNFVYARLSDSIGGGAPIEMVRGGQPRNSPAQPQQIGQKLNPWLTGDLGAAPLLMPNPIGEGEVSIAPLRLGLQDHVGVLVAGSRRADFPTEIEMLLLRVAANQAAIGLQEARLLSEQRRVAEELDRRVVERTRQLTAVNEELRKEIIERKQAEEALRRAQAELAHVTRVMTMGELTTSIAHEINQPLAAVVTNANACLRWLAGPIPNLGEAQEALARITRDGNRASNVIGRIRALVKKGGTEQAHLNVNEVIQEVVGLIQSEIQKTGAVLRMELTADLPLVFGDRVQLQQVILNLVMNGIEAMSGVTDRPRDLLIKSVHHESDKVLVAVQDSGIGVDQDKLEEIFSAFYTTKPQGMGMGLAISRSIVENHGGRLLAVLNDGPGVTFEFALPVESTSAI